MVLPMRMRVLFFPATVRSARLLFVDDFCVADATGHVCVFCLFCREMNRGLD